MSYGLMEGVCAALRTGKVSEKGMNAFRKGGALNLAAELMEDGHLTDASLAKFLGTVRVAVASEVREVVFPRLTLDQQRAASIMGAGFVSPQAYANALRLKVAFSDADLAALATVPWTDAELAEEAALGSMLWPHFAPVTLPVLRKTFGVNPKRQPCFYKGNEDWYLADEHKSLRDNALPTGWHLVRTVPEANSTSITWDAQTALIPATHERTWTLEVVEMTLLGYRIQKKRFLETLWAWCQDLDGNGYRSLAGYFDPTGLNLYGSHPSDAWYGSALVLSRKASQPSALGTSG